MRLGRIVVFGLMMSGALAFGATPSLGQLQLPPTGVGSGIQPGVGYGLITLGNEGPYITTDIKVGSAPAPGATPAPTPVAGAMPLLGPQEARLLIRDAKGVPAFKAMASKGATFPSLVIRSAHRLNTFTNVTIVSAVDAFGSATAAVPIANVTIRFASFTSQFFSGSPEPNATGTPFTFHN